MDNKKQKQKYFAQTIFEEDSYGIPYELFAAESPLEKWQNNLRWTMAVSSDEAKNNIKAKLKNKLGYTWKEVQKISMEFGPVTKEEFIGGYKNKDNIPKEKESSYVNLWTSRKDYVNVNIDNCTAIKESSLFTVSIPIMDTNLTKFIEHYKYHQDNWCLVDESNTPLCAFTFRENAEAIGSIMKRKIVRLYVDKSLW